MEMQGLVTMPTHQQEDDSQLPARSNVKSCCVSRPVQVSITHKPSVGCVLGQATGTIGFIVSLLFLITCVSLGHPPCLFYVQVLMMMCFQRVLCVGGGGALHDILWHATCSDYGVKTKHKKKRVPLHVK